MTYDGLGRRISKTVTGSGDMNATYKFFYDGRRVIETHNGSDQVIKHKVWGPTYVDELVQVATNDNPTVDDDMDDSYVILDDANFNVIGMMNDDHDLIERREYHPYGRRQVFINGPNDSSDYTCKSEIPYPQVVVLGSTPQAYSICDEGHQGLMHDKATGQINVRTRYLDAILCRYIGRDILEYIDGSNMYAYLMDSPGNYTDWRGAETEKMSTSGSFFSRHYTAGDLEKNRVKPDYHPKGPLRGKSGFRSWAVDVWRNPLNRMPYRAPSQVYKKMHFFKNHKTRNWYDIVEKPKVETIKCRLTGKDIPYVVVEQRLPVRWPKNTDPKEIELTKIRWFAEVPVGEALWEGPAAEGMAELGRFVLEKEVKRYGPVIRWYGIPHIAQFGHYEKTLNLPAVHSTWKMEKAVVLGYSWFPSKTEMERAVAKDWIVESFGKMTQQAIEILLLADMAQGGLVRTSPTKLRPIRKPSRVKPKSPSTPPKGTAKGGKRVIPQAGAQQSGVWDSPPVLRGEIIERQLGQNLPGNYPVIDRFNNGIATSIKSMNLSDKTYLNARAITRVGGGYVDDVVAFQGRNWAGVNIRQSDIIGRGLDLAVPKGASQAQSTALKALVEYGKGKGVTVKIVEIP